MNQYECSKDKYLTFVFNVDPGSNSYEDWKMATEEAVCAKGEADRAKAQAAEEVDRAKAQAAKEVDRMKRKMKEMERELAKRSRVADK